MSHVHQAGEAFASNAAESRQEIRNYTMNFGPQHPAAHGVLRLILKWTAKPSCVPTRTWVCCTVAPKLAESKPFNQSIGYMDRLDYVSMMCNEHAYVRAIETLMGIEAPGVRSTSAPCMTKSPASSTT